MRPGRGKFINHVDRLPAVLEKTRVALNFRDPPNVPAYGWSYLDHLVAVYVNLNKADKRADEVILKAKNTPDDLTWGDIFLLENIVFSMQPQEVIARSAWSLRARFRDVAGSVVYDRYVASGIPTETDTAPKLALLRADLTRVLDILHWYYSLLPLRERDSYLINEILRGNGYFLFRSSGGSFRAGATSTTRNMWRWFSVSCTAELSAGSSVPSGVCRSYLSMAIRL